MFRMDRQINSNDDAVSQILSDNYSGCVAIGEYFVKEMGGKGKYIELLGILGDIHTKSATSSLWRTSFRRLAGAFATSMATISRP